ILAVAEEHRGGPYRWRELGYAWASERDAVDTGPQLYGELCRPGISRRPVCAVQLQPAGDQRRQRELQPAPGCGAVVDASGRCAVPIYGAAVPAVDRRQYLSAGPR